MARGVHPAVLTQDGLEAAPGQPRRPLAPARSGCTSRSTGGRRRRSRRRRTSSSARRSPTPRATRARASSSRRVARPGSPHRRGARRRHRRREARPRRGPARPRRPVSALGRAPGGRQPAGRRNHGQDGAAMRVILADDAVLLREGLARILTDSGFEVVGQAGDAPSLVDLVRQRGRRTWSWWTCGCRPGSRARASTPPPRSARSPRRGAGAALAARGGPPRDAADDRLRRRRGLPAQGPGLRPRSLCRRRTPGRGWATWSSTPSW